MNVTDQWMLERMQQMAANMAGALPQTAQNTEASKTENGESFQDLMNKAKDQKADAPKKDTSANKTETAQGKEPAQKTESKVVTNMRDPRIRAMSPQTQAQIAAGFLTPVELSDGSLLLQVNSEPCAIVAAVLPNGQTDWSHVTLVNSDGEEFEVYLDLENGDHQLFQLMAGGEKKQIDLFPEQPKLDLLNNPESLDMTVIDSEGKVTTLREVIAANKDDSEDDADVNAEVMTPKEPLFHDVKAAPVKVGENFQLDTQQADMDEQLASTIQLAAQQGLKQLEIKLSPENLGNLTIKLTQASDGTLQVVLHATNAKAANLLNQHISSLNAALQGYSQNEVRVEVQRGGDSQQTEQQNQQTDPNGHNQQQQQQQRQQESKHSGDFMQKLRLGLFGLEDTI